MFCYLTESSLLAVFLRYLASSFITGEFRSKFYTMQIRK